MNVNARIGWAAAFGILLTLLVSAPVAAKTFVSSTSMPDQIVAGEPFEVTMTMEDHGSMLTGASQMTLMARRMGDSEELRFDAVSDGDPLDWTATVTLPDDGVWVLTIESPVLGFMQDLSSIRVEPNPAAPVTRAQMDSAITSATEGLVKQVNSLHAEVDGLQKQLTTLSAERDVLQKQVTTLAADRDTLQKQVSSLQGATAQATETSSSASWWLVTAIGAVGAVVGAVISVAAHRFVPRRITTRREPLPATN